MLFFKLIKKIRGIKTFEIARTRTHGFSKLMNSTIFDFPEIER